MEHNTTNHPPSCCSRAAEQAATPSGRAPVGGPFSLINHHGQLVTRDSYRGRFVLIFFGFTHCKVVCPRALQRISDALALLGDACAEKLAALYITVDPERDTPEAMRAFLHERYPAIIGHTGSQSQIADVTSKFRVFAKRAEDADAPGGYVVPHTALTYLLDPDGRYAAHFSDAVSAEELASKLRQFLQAAPQACGRSQGT